MVNGAPANDVARFQTALNQRVEGSSPSGGTVVSKCKKMPADANTSCFQGVLSFTGCLGRAGVQCQQMTGNASKVLPVGEALGKPGGSISADLAQVIEAWKKLPKATKQAIIAIVDAAKPRKRAG